MESLVRYKENLPFNNNVEDIAVFALFNREKLNSVRAEIRAMDKLQLAEEVRNQKKEEAQLLAEALLDAEVRLGELFQQLPKAQGFASDKSNIYNTGQKSTELIDNDESDDDIGVDSKNKSNIYNTSQQCYELVDNDKNASNKGVTSKTKKEITQEMGFDKMTVSRFETLAKNKDLVEQVKQEARENDDVPTRTQVLSLAKARKQMQEQKEEQFKEFCDRSEKGKKLYGKLIDCLGFINRLDSEDIHNCMINLDDTMANDMLERLKSLKIQVALLEQETKKYKGVKIWQDD